MGCPRAACIHMSPQCGCCGVPANGRRVPHTASYLAVPNESGMCHTQDVACGSTDLEPCRLVDGRIQHAQGYLRQFISIRRPMTWEGERRGFYFRLLVCLPLFDINYFLADSQKKLTQKTVILNCLNLWPRPIKAVWVNMIKHDQNRVSEVSG